MLYKSLKSLNYTIKVSKLINATDPGVEGSNPGWVNQINHVSSMKM